jgi:hypothetical protein
VPSPLCVGLPLPLASLTYLAFLGQAFGHSGKSADKGETEDVSKKTTVSRTLLLFWASLFRETM